MKLRTTHGVTVCKTNAPSIQLATNDYTDKVLHPIELQWYEDRDTPEKIYAISK